ncbi:MAG TPA: proprotein convertase P-domain-containing protein, partial [Terrimicrobiaceae bacterium]|nr:proprotein convertase P-domain-containing protein [Terrimicrobiaceae bacterium]
LGRAEASPNGRMRINRLLGAGHLVLGAVIFHLVVCSVGWAQTPLRLSVVNRNPNFTAEQVYLMFGGITSGLVATATVDGTPNTGLVLGTSYALSRISDIRLTTFRAGRLFISYGAPFTSASPGTAWNPNFNNPSLPDYNMRWDKIEITYDVGLRAGGANLSATDFFSIPLQINTFTAGNPNSPLTTLTWTAPTATVFSSIAALSGGNATAVLTGSNGLQTQNYGQVLRVVRPATVPNPAVYASFNPYINFVRSGNISTPMVGSFNDSQSFNLTAIVDASGLVMTGTVTGVPVAQTTIIIASQDLPNGIYTANPPYTVNGALHHIADNDVYAVAVRDVLAGFNLGFIGSNETNPNTGASFGAGPSNKWYQPPVPVKLAFAGAQPANSNFYNQYASYLSSVSAAYAFPFTDLIQSPFASLDPTVISAMDVVILPDSVSRTLTSAPPSQAPKPLPDRGQITSLLRVQDQPNTAYSNITVNLDIDHAAIGDLVVKLRSPQGRTFVLHDQTGGTTDNLDLIGFALPSSQIANPNGVWMLSISDRKRENAGRLVDWGLSFPTKTKPDKDRWDRRNRHRDHRSRWDR